MELSAIQEIEPLLQQHRTPSRASSYRSTEQPGATVHPGHHQPDSGGPEFSHRQLAHRRRLDVNLSTSVFPFLVYQKASRSDNYPGIFANFLRSNDYIFHSISAKSSGSRDGGPSSLRRHDDRFLLRRYGYPRWSRFTATGKPRFPAFNLASLPFTSPSPRHPLTGQTFSPHLD